MKILMRILMVLVTLFALIAGGLLIGNMLHYFYLDNVAQVTNQQFEAYSSSTITADSTVQFNSSSEYGKFCFTKAEDGQTLCSEPNPRPDNANAHSLKGEFTPGTWTVTTSEYRVTIQSDQDLTHCENNKRGFVGMAVIFGAMYLAMLGLSIHGLKIVFSKDALY